MAFSLMLMQSIVAYNKRFTSVLCPGIRSVAAALASTVNHFCKYETNVLSSHKELTVRRGLTDLQHCEITFVTI